MGLGDLLELLGWHFTLPDVAPSYSGSFGYGPQKPSLMRLHNQVSSALQGLVST